MPKRGSELRAERRAAEVSTIEVAARMGISRQALWVIERSEVVKAERALQYLDALRDAIEASRAAEGAA